MGTSRFAGRGRIPLQLLLRSWRCGVRFVVFGVIALFSISYGQPPDTMWTRTFGGENTDYLTSIWQTLDGGFIAVGTTFSFGSGGSDIYLVKTDSLGNQEWYQTFGGPGVDSGYDVCQTSDTQLIIVGEYHVNPFDSTQVILVRTDPLGNMIWSENYSAPSFSHCAGYALSQTLDGGFVVAGIASQSGGNEADALLLKIDSTGNLEWLRVYGGPGQDAAYSVSVIPDGGYAVAGSTSSFGSAGRDFYLVRVSGVGDTLWTRSYGTTEDDWCYSLARANNGDLLLGGTSLNQGNSGNDLFVVRVTDQGTMLWSRHYGDSGNQSCSKVCQSDNNEFVLFGTQNYVSEELGNFFVLAINADGDSAWSGIYGTPYLEQLYSGQVTDDGGFVMAGITYVQGSPEEFEGYVVRTQTAQTEISTPEAVAPSSVYALTTFPNPFNANLDIFFQLSHTSRVILSVNNVLGQQKLLISDSWLSAGSHHARLSLAEFATGSYFVVLSTPDDSIVRKICLIK